MARGHEWHPALLQGWALAAWRQRDTAWAQALLQLALAAQVAGGPAPFAPHLSGPLLDLLDDRQCSDLLAPQHLHTPVELAAAIRLLAGRQAGLDATTSREVARAVVRVLRQYPLRSAYPRSLGHELFHLARLFPPEIYPDLAAGWSVSGFDEPWYQSFLDDTLQHLALRRARLASLDDVPADGQAS
ncbi:MAG: hypothetical protein OHK0039_29560 [Bacteroidia bacterium]